MSENFLLDRVGEVVLALTESGLSWEPVRTPQDVSVFMCDCRFCSSC